MRFRIPRSILRAAIAANVFVAASAACYSSIPGNRNNSYQPIGLIDVAEANGLMTLGRIDKLPNFVLYSPVGTNMSNIDANNGQSVSDIETKPIANLSNGNCEIDQDFAGCWMTCPEESSHLSSESNTPAIEDQKQIDYIDRQQWIAWAESSSDAIRDSIEVVSNYAIEAPFDAGMTVAQFFAFSRSQIESSENVSQSGNIFVYVVEQVDALNHDAYSADNSAETDPIQNSLVKINPFQSGIQELISEIESSIASKNLGCGYDPYESCFPNEIADSSAVYDNSIIENTRLVTEDEFIPFHVKLQSGQFDMALTDATDAGVGHCAIPTPTAASTPADSEGSAFQDIAAIESHWRPQLQAARSMIESWMEPSWDTRKWEFVTRSNPGMIESRYGGTDRAPKFRWDAVFGRVDAPMLSEIPIDPSLTLVHDLYPQPNWYVSANRFDRNAPIDETPIEETAIEHGSNEYRSSEVAIIEPKVNSDSLLPLAQEAWASIGKTIRAQYAATTGLWQKFTLDSKQIVAAQMKRIGSLLLRSADSLEGSVGLAKRDVHQNDGNR
ncbi:MAG: hypothetical protein MUC43_02530 [Pirellula sp.]|jgi:hypothetical protein|nr:hypothetical protein [Pirellula sp.]